MEKKKERLLVNKKTHTIANLPCNSLRKIFSSLFWNNWRSQLYSTWISIYWVSSPRKSLEGTERGQGWTQVGEFPLIGCSFCCVMGRYLTWVTSLRQFFLIKQRGSKNPG